MEKERNIIAKQYRVDESVSDTLVELSEEFGVSQNKLITDLISERTKLVKFIKTIRDHLSNGDRILINTKNKEYIGTNMTMSNNHNNNKDTFGNNAVNCLSVYKSYMWQLTSDFENFYLTKHTTITFYKIMSDEIADVKQISTSPFTVNTFKDLYYHFLNVNIENLNIEVTPTK